MAKEDEKDAAEAKSGGRRGKLIIMVLPTVLLLVGGAWFVFFRSSGPSVPKALPAPVPGPVVALDSFTINLAGGHYLKLGLTLQPTKAAGGELSGAKALDLAINEFSGKSITELSTAEGRQAAKDELVARIKLAYLPEGSKGEQALSAAISATKGRATASATATAGPTGRAIESADEVIRDLTPKQAIAAADALTVQTGVYDVYFTEFVMQ